MPPPPPLPDDPPGLIVQAAAHLIADGQAAVAAARLEALVAVAPAYPAAHVLLARALEATGREVEALAAWHRAHFLVPNSPLVQRERARLTAALAAAPQSTPAADGATEPEALAAAPGGALPDAHLAFVAEEEIPEEAPDEVPAEPEDASSEAPEAAGDEAPPGPEEPDEDAPIEVEVMAPDAREGEAPTDGPPDPEPSAPDEDGWAVLEETELPPASTAEVGEAEVAPPDPPASVGDEAPGLADTLDALIHQLEDAPRIRPDPTFRGPAVTFDEEVADDMVSETLARIYAAQKQYAEAAIVYEKLAQQRPEQSDELLRRAAEMRAQGDE